MTFEITCSATPTFVNTLDNWMRRTACKPRRACSRCNWRPYPALLPRSNYANCSNWCRDQEQRTIIATRRNPMKCHTINNNRETQHWPSILPRRRKHFLTAWKWTTDHRCSVLPESRACRSEWSLSMICTAIYKSTRYVSLDRMQHSQEKISRLVHLVETLLPGATIVASFPDIHLINQSIQDGLTGFAKGPVK